MEPTQIDIFPVEGEEKLKAYVTLTFNDCFAVRDIKLIKHPDDGRLFMAMPSKKLKDGSFRDIAHPVNAETRNKLEKLVINAYLKHQEKQLENHTYP